GDEFAPMEEMELEIEVENNGDKDIDDVIVEAFLFVKDPTAGEFDRVEDIESDEVNIAEDEKEEFLLTLEVPDSDIDEDDDYILFVKAYESGHEEDHCAEEEIEIDIERKKHQVVISEFDLSSYELSCGGFITANIDLENLGTSEEEDMFVALNIPELGLEEVSPRFTLEEFDGNNDISKKLSLKIPSDIKSGTYALIAGAVFDDDEETEVKEKQIIINDCEPGEIVYELKTDVDLESVFERNRGDSIVFPIEIMNTGDRFAEYQVVISDSGFIDPVTQNVLIGGQKTRFVNVDTKIKEDASFGEHAVNVNVMSGGKLIDSKNLIVRVNQPEVVGGDGKVASVLTLLNLLGILVLIYFLVLLFR
ncbi:MAG: putative S-layer protein, partial [Candidatus Woesearchaeota archaeon]